MTNGNGNGVYKWIAMTVCGVLLGMAIQIFRTPSDLVREGELNLRIIELQNKIDAQTNEIIALRSSVNQQSVDIAGIASKVGATAHPVVAPSR